jgi:hypothetical protein
MNTDTPRTDEAAVDVWRKSNGERMATSSDKVDADFARCLERELNEARFDLDFSRRLVHFQSKTIDDLTAQRDEARAESIRWMSIAEGRGRTDDEEQCHTCGSTSTIDNGSACAQCGCDKSLTPKP